jgi:P4 family phage/plasmid primase-like protien
VDPAQELGKNFIPQLAEEIQSQHVFAKDSGGALYRLDSGVMVADGEDLIKRLVCARLRQPDGIPWRSRIGKEVADHIGLNVTIMDERPPMTHLNLKNGWLNLKTLELTPHTPRDPLFMSHTQLPVLYDPGATCPFWEKFVSEVCPADTQEIAWELAAYLMLPITSSQKAILCSGSGSNGKSAFLFGIEEFLGRTNFCNLNLQDLATNRFASVNLIGKLANIFHDQDNTKLASTSAFLTIVGGDTIMAEYKLGKSFSFRPYARLVFSANEVPYSDNHSEGFLRRWLIIPFPRQFPVDKAKFEEIQRNLANPKELSGLLNRAIAVLPRVLQYGITETASMRNKIDEFRSSGDPLLTWVQENLAEGPQEKWLTNAAILAAANEVLPKEATPQALGRVLNQIFPKCEGRTERIGKVPMYVRRGLMWARETVVQ